MTPAALAASSIIGCVNARTCPPLGPVLLAPRTPSSSEAVKQVVGGLQFQLNQMLGATMKASGVSIGVKSLHEENSLFNFHYTPQVTSGIGADTIDEDTIYRVGSVSKLVPVLLALQLEIDLDASILEFLPELGGQSYENLIDTIQWKDITAKSLMSHLSGIPTHTAATTDLTILPNYPWNRKGLPAVPEGEGAKCSETPPLRPCDAADLLENLKHRRPAWLPYASSPGYSNIGYALLGLVLEAYTGEKFESLAQKHIFDVAGMDSTSFSAPVEASEDRVFVPVMENTWNVTLGVYEPAGGMFSSTKDLLRFMEAIASHKLLSPVETRKWLKPQAHTSSLSRSVGDAWEILRSDSITSDGRVVDVYTKLGAVGLYQGIVGIIPDYDVVFSVLLSGPEVNLYSQPQLTSAVVKALVPAIEEAGKAEARTHSAGVYVDKKTNSTLKLEIDDGPGFRVTELTVRGYNVLKNIFSYTLQAAAIDGGAGIELPEMYTEIRLNPTDRISSSGIAGNGTTETAWRAVFDIIPPEQVEAIESGLFYKDGTCIAWTSFDAATYNFEAIGEFVFTNGADGATLGISNAAFDVSFIKVSCR
ncbi:Beta-lactamase-like protein [Paramyrothecium foliicola]|nr:Beta-lactamase-like protein [Paramyrothecium foliicola]